MSATVNSSFSLIVAELTAVSSPLPILPSLEAICAIAAQSSVDALRSSIGGTLKHERS